jgi:choline transporter-like protein 2/4/5
MFVIAGAGVASGNPERLIYGTDYLGNVCGSDTMKDKPLVYYPRMNKDLLDAASKGTSVLDTNMYGICVPNCPKQGPEICNYDQYSVDANGLETYTGSPSQKLNIDWISSTGPCWRVGITTTPTLFRCIPEQNQVVTRTERCVDEKNESRMYYEIDDRDGPTVQSGNRLYSEVTGLPTRFCETIRFEETTTGLESGQENPLFEKMSSITGMFSKWAGDIQTVGVYVGICGIGLSLILGFLFLLWLRFCAGCTVWCVVILVMFLCCTISFGVSVKAGMIGTGYFETTPMAGYSDSLATETNAENQKMYEVVAWICIITTCVLSVMILFARHKINICVGILRESSHCLRSIPMLILWPIVPTFMFVCLFVYWFVIGAYIASAGDESLTAYANDQMSNVNDATATAAGAVANAADTVANATDSSVNSTAIQNFQFQSFSSSNMSAYMSMIHLFGFLWTNQVIQAISMCTIAGAVNKFYWARDKTQMSGRPILIGLYNALRYHIGSLIFGSLIVAIVQFIRVILAYIDHKTQGLQESNILIKIGMKCVQCCLWCMEKCLKYISKSAYVMIAMQGGSFWTSTKKAVGLLFANIGQIAVANSIVIFLLLLAEISIALICAAAMYLVIDSNEKYAVGGAEELSSPMVPVMLVAVIAWFIADKFMGLFGNVVDSTLLMFCVDKATNSGTVEGVFMSDELARLLGEKKVKGEAAEAGKKDASDAPNKDADAIAD